MKNNCDIYKDKIILSKNTINPNDPNLSEKERKFVEYQKLLYLKICQNLGLDPSRGQLVLVRSKEKTLDEDDEIKIDKEKNKAFIGKDEFDEYLKFMNKLAEQENQKLKNNVEELKNTENVLQDMNEILKSLKSLETKITDFIKKYLV